jgi:soluble lytic murein transglycosylase-like protein
MGRAGRVLIAAVLALLVTAGCGLIYGNEPDKSGAAPAAVSDTSTPSAEPTEEPTTEAPPSPAPTTKKPTKKPTKKATTAPPTQPAFWSELPACAHYDKTKKASKAKVKSALKSASARVYWRTEAPQLKLNYPLVKAVAWQESGWQSNIHNCDGGTGVMQVMPGTVDQINGRFGLTYDPTVLADNAFVGSNYLAWLTKWAGDRYFKNSYNLSSSKCKSVSSWCLLNVVISGYNAGQGGLEGAEASRTLSNPEYVAAVRALMKRCQCDSY